MLRTYVTLDRWTNTLTYANYIQIFKNAVTLDVQLSLLKYFVYDSNAIVKLITFQR